MSGPAPPGPAACPSAGAAMRYRRKLKLKTKIGNGSSLFSFKRRNHAQSTRGQPAPPCHTVYQYHLHVVVAQDEIHSKVRKQLIMF